MSDPTAPVARFPVTITVDGPVGCMKSRLLDVIARALASELGVAVTAPTLDAERRAQDFSRPLAAWEQDLLQRLDVTLVERVILPTPSAAALMHIADQLAPSGRPAHPRAGDLIAPEALERLLDEQAHALPRGLATTHIHLDDVGFLPRDGEPLPPGVVGERGSTP